MATQSLKKHVYLTDATHSELKILAAQLGMKMQDAAAEAIGLLVAKTKKENGKRAA